MMTTTDETWLQPNRKSSPATMNEPTRSSPDRATTLRCSFSRSFISKRLRSNSGFLINNTTPIIRIGMKSSAMKSHAPG